MEDCLAIARECGDSRRIASSTDNLGFFWQQRGDLERARSLHEESLAISQTIGDQSLVAAALTNLGSTARQQGAFADARSALTQSLSIARDTADRSRDVADVLEELAALEVAQGRDRKGLTLFASAETIRQAVGYPLREFFRANVRPAHCSCANLVPDHEEVWNDGTHDLCRRRDQLGAGRGLICASSLVHIVPIVVGSACGPRPLAASSSQPIVELPDEALGPPGRTLEHLREPLPVVLSGGIELRRRRRLLSTPDIVAAPDAVIVP